MVFDSFINMTIISMNRKQRLAEAENELVVNFTIFKNDF
jgi:hypothetical protein